MARSTEGDRRDHGERSGTSRSPVVPTAVLAVPAVLGSVLLTLALTADRTGPSSGMAVPLALVVALAPFGVLVLLVWPQWVTWRRRVPNPWRSCLWLAAALEWLTLAVVLTAPLAWSGAGDDTPNVAAGWAGLPWIAADVTLLAGAVGSWTRLRRHPGTPRPVDAPEGGGGRTIRRPVARTIGLTVAGTVVAIGVVLAVFPEKVFLPGGGEGGTWCVPAAHALRPMREVTEVVPSEASMATIAQLPPAEKDTAWSSFRITVQQNASDRIANRCTRIVRPRLAVGLGVLVVGVALAVVSVRLTGGRTRGTGGPSDTAVAATG